MKISHIRIRLYHIKVPWYYHGMQSIMVTFGALRVARVGQAQI